MNIAIPDRYLLADDFEQRAIDFNFPAEVWNVAAALAEVSEATSPYELEQLTGHDSGQVREALERLLAKQLVRQNLMTWKEYTAARELAYSAATAGGVSQGASAKVAPLAGMPPGKQAHSQAAATVGSTVRNGHLPAQDGVALRLGSISPQQAAAGAANAWLWQKPNAAQVAASKPAISAAMPNGEQSNGRRLRPMLAQIENLKGGGVEGQLLVYQVFLRVPYELLHNEGIKSLHFVDERTVINNPVLYDAIVKAAKDVTGIDLV